MSFLIGGVANPKGPKRETEAWICVECGFHNKANYATCFGTLDEINPITERPKNCAVRAPGRPYLADWKGMVDR